MDIGRNRTARLVRSLGVKGVRRSRRVKTTTPDPAAMRHPNLEKHYSTATVPNQLWVRDFALVSTWAGVT